MKKVSASKAADKKSTKTMGMSAKEYEGSPADRRSGIRSAVKKAISSSKKSTALRKDFPY